MTAPRITIGRWVGWLLFAFMQGSLANEPVAGAPDPAPTAPQPAQAVAPTATAPAGSKRERALFERLDAGTLGPDYLRLEDPGGDSFLVRYVPGQHPPRASAVLVVPGRDSLISADPFIDALLSELPAAGWATMVVQLPLDARDRQAADDGEMIAAVQARLATALARLLADGIPAIVVVGLEEGAALLATTLATGFGQPAVQAFASRGLWHGELGDTRLPRLEILSTDDVGATALAAAREQAALRAGLPYRRRLYSGLGRDFAASAALARDLRGWITKLPTSH